MPLYKTGWQELARTRQAMYDKGEETLKWMEENGRHGIVLAGRPYHVDSEINHGIPELINSYGLAVLTEDSVSNLQSAGTPADRHGSVDVPQPSVCRSQLCQDTEMIWT